MLRRWNDGRAVRAGRDQQDDSPEPGVTRVAQVGLARICAFIRRNRRALSTSPIATADENQTATGWAETLKAYRTPTLQRSLGELAITTLAFAALWAATYAAYQGSFWLALLVAFPAAGFLMRLFMIQHDCGHGAFFASKVLNDWVGRVISVLTLTPYDLWRRSHAIHHATSGHLERRGVGDIKTLTVEEYRALPFWGRLRYRLYRHPIVMFGLGPIFLFLLEQRVPFSQLRGAGWQPWASTMGTNLGIAAFAAAMIALVGWKAFLAVHLPIVGIAAAFGVWLFYVQHQFEHTYWHHGQDWSLKDAALLGSSHYELPRPLAWLTAYIGIHHVHHLVSHIPFYRLPDVLRDHPRLRDMGRLTISESLCCVRLALWDESRQRLISFREYARMVPQGA
jgi:acyl-lipid omega-6 desaturase (Delta-12 desaturase)